MRRPADPLSEKRVEAVAGGEKRVEAVDGGEKKGAAPAVCFTKKGGEDAKFLDTYVSHNGDKTSSGTSAGLFGYEEFCGGHLMFGRRPRRGRKTKDKKSKWDVAKEMEEILNNMGDQEAKGFPREEEEEEDEKDDIPMKGEIDQIIGKERKEDQERAEAEITREEELMEKLKLQQQNRQSEYEQEEAISKVMVNRQEAQRIKTMASYNQRKHYFNQMATSADTHWDCVKNRARRAREYLADKTSSVFDRKKVDPEVKVDATPDVEEGAKPAAPAGGKAH